MTFDFQYPNINGATEREQLQQMRSYIHQLVDQLKWALNSVDSSQGNYNVVTGRSNSNTNSGIATVGVDGDTVQTTFDELKPLIIKSAEIVDAYYEEINRRLEGLYVAQSDFGTYIEQTSQDIQQNSTDITQMFTNVQTIATDVGTIGSEVQTIDSKVKTIDSSVKTIDSTVKTVETNVQTIDSNVKSIETTIVTVSKDVENVDTELKGVKTEVQTVTQEVGKVDTELKEVKTGVQAVDQRVGEVNTELQGVKTGVESVETEVEGVKSSVGSNLQVIAEDIDKVDSELQGLKEDTDTNIQGINENLEAVSDGLGQVDTELQGFKEEASNDLEGIKDEIENIKYMIIDVNAYIKSGLLYYDESEIPIYGLEIGQRNNINGVEVFNKFARFTSDRLSFYDQNDIEVAYISDKKLYISDVEVLRSFKIGGIKKIVLSNGDVVKKWVGTGGEV